MGHYFASYIGELSVPGNVSHSYDLWDIVKCQFYLLFNSSDASAAYLQSSCPPPASTCLNANFLKWLMPKSRCREKLAVGINGMDIYSRQLLDGRISFVRITFLR